MYERTRFGTTPHSQKVVQDSDAYLHRSLSQDLSSSDVRQEEQEDTSLGWQASDGEIKAPTAVVRFWLGE